MGEKDHSDKALAGDGGLTFVPKAAIDAVRAATTDPIARAALVASNTGSLGMGIAKAYGMARARRFAGRGGRIVLMTGDGELQEGQIWESLQPAANERLAEIIAVVDHNKLQSDAAVSAVSDLGPLEDKFRAFGWEVRRVDGHDFRAIRDAFAYF